MNEKDNPMPVNYVDDITYDVVHDSARHNNLPQCPACLEYPTYDEKRCPFCGQLLSYPWEQDLKDFDADMARRGKK